MCGGLSAVRTIGGHGPRAQFPCHPGLVRRWTLVRYRGLNCCCDSTDGTLHNDAAIDHHNHG